MVINKTNMNMKNTAFLIAVAFALTSCTDSNKAKLTGYGSEHKVEVINCDGSITHRWISSGKVQSESNSDGYYFNDKETGNLIEVTGNIIITQL
jgi:hypothetical protein